MNGCTEEQALNWFEVWCQATLDERFHKVLALAKRTAEAEDVAKRCDGHGAREAALVAERDALKARVAELEKERTKVVEKCCYATDEERQSVLGGISLADHIRSRLNNIALQRDQAEATNRNNLRVSSDLLESKVKQMEHMDQDLQAARRERDALKARVAKLEAKRCVCNAAGPCLEHEEAWLKKAKELLADEDEPPVQPVVVTREMVEALAEEAETRALYLRTRNGGDDPSKPANAAARLVTELRKMLEVKP